MTTDKHISSISLLHVIPEVFSDNEAEESEIWLRDFTFTRGKFYAVEAESGSGKSSLCSFIYHNRSDYRGTILLDSTDARSLDRNAVAELRRSHISILPQELRLFPELTAMENILLKNRLSDYRSETDIRHMLDRLGIANRADTPAGRLSVGQMQRVAFVRALCQPYDFLLLDEPVSHLDSTNNRLVAEMAAEDARRQGAALITTSVGNPLMLPADETIRIAL